MKFSKKYSKWKEKKLILENSCVGWARVKFEKIEIGGLLFWHSKRHIDT